MRSTKESARKRNGEMREMDPATREAKAAAGLRVPAKRNGGGHRRGTEWAATQLGLEARRGAAERRVMAAPLHEPPAQHNCSPTTAGAARLGFRADPSPRSPSRADAAHSPYQLSPAPAAQAGSQLRPSHRVLFHSINRPGSSKLLHRSR
jgi:hypothetical protein